MLLAVHQVIVNVPTTGNFNSTSNEGAIIGLVYIQDIFSYKPLNTS